jgi:transposase
MTPRVRVFIRPTPTDMRKSFDTLAALVRQDMGGDVLTGDVYLFVGRDRKRAKTLYFDGTGLCLLHKRLSRGHFAAPWAEDGRTHMTVSELALFMEGSDIVGRQPLSPRPMERADMFVPEDAFG